MDANVFAYRNVTNIMRSHSPLMKIRQIRCTHQTFFVDIKTAVKISDFIWGFVSKLKIFPPQLSCLLKFYTRYDHSACYFYLSAEISLSAGNQTAPRGVIRNQLALHGGVVNSAFRECQGALGQEVDNSSLISVDDDADDRADGPLFSPTTTTVDNSWARSGAHQTGPEMRL